MQQVELAAVSKNEAQEVIKHTQVAEPTSADLSVVAPRHRLSLTSYDQTGSSTELQFWLSKVYRLSPGGSHYCVTAYAGENERDTSMRSFYLSQSSGEWRVSPFSLVNDRREVIHMGKGYHHNSVVLVPELQKGLALATDAQPRIGTLPNAKRLFYAAAPIYDDCIDIYGMLDANEDLSPEDRNLMRADYVRLVNPIGDLFGGAFYARANKVPPSKLNFYYSGDDNQPNFQELIDAWTQRSGLYKQIEKELFLSLSERIVYMMCTDPEGKSWIGSIQNDREVLTDLGVMDQWINPGDLVTARFEHTTLVDGRDALHGYGSRRTRRSGYSDMWPKYLSQVPMIQEYQAQRKLRQES